MIAQSPTKALPDPAIDVLVEAPVWRNLPDAENIIRRAITAASEEGTKGHSGGEISVLLCDDATITGLNSHWRGEERPTNVLSFPAPVATASPGGEAGLAPLGDIAIAYETVAREAEREGKPVADHLAHLAVHGFLHLLGYDHHMEAEAERMERLERDILARIGISDPYASRDADI